MSDELDNELHNYFTQLNEVEKKSLMQMIKTYLQKKSKDDSEVSGRRMTIEEYNQEINEAEAEYERGEYFTHEEFLKFVNTWKSGNTD